MPARSRTSPLAMWLVAALLTAAVSTSVRAGTICGTVRDADTNLPVAQAAVFLFDDLGNYTGHHTATDGGGSYCLTDVDPGMYSLQVRRDDYVTTVIDDIEVMETTTSVNVVAYPGLHLRAWPNPASTETRIEVGVPDGAPITLEIYDIKGRLIRGWRGSGGGTRTITWNLRDVHGNRVASGIYLVRLSSGDRQITRNLVHFR